MSLPVGALLRVPLLAHAAVLTLAGLAALAWALSSRGPLPATAPLAAWSLLASASLLLHRWRSASRPAPEDIVAAGLAGPDETPNSPFRHFALELRASRPLLSRIGTHGPTARSAEPGAHFLVRAIAELPEFEALTVPPASPASPLALSSPASRHRSEGGSRVSVWGFDRRRSPSGEASAAYGELLGELDITGRRIHVLEVTIDVRALGDGAGGGSVDGVAAMFRRRVAGALRHRGIAARELGPLELARLREEWGHSATAHRHARLLAAPSVRDGSTDDDSGADLAPPLAQGAGPVLGADSRGRAVCLDLCGPHVSRALLAASTDTIDRLILRVAALGWSVAIVSDTPDRWRGLAHAAEIEVLYSGTAFSRGPRLDPARRPDLATDLNPALGLGLGSAFRLAGSPAPQCDLLLWDSTSPAPGRRFSGALHATVCVVVTGEPADMERAFAAESAKDPDLVVDGRVKGRLSLAVRYPDQHPADAVTIQTVEHPAETALLERARAAPAPRNTLLL